MKPFYLILRDKRVNSVTEIYWTAESAAREAARIARVEGDRCFVLKVLGSVEQVGTQPLKWEKAE